MKLLLGIVLISMLLIAGCTGGEQTPPAEAPPTEAPPTPPTQTGGEVEPSTPEEESGEFDTWDLTTMMVSAQPIYCTVDYTEGDFTGSSKMWIKGDMLRVETSSMTAGTTDEYMMTMISTGDTTYIMNVDGGYAVPSTGGDCDWISINVKELEACMPAGDEPEEMDEYDFESSYDEAPSSFHCEVGTFGEEKFQTTGKVCDLTADLCSIYEGVANGTGVPGMTPEEMCGQLEGEQKAECMAALGLE